MNERPKSPSEMLQEEINRAIKRKPLRERMKEVDGGGPSLDQLISEKEIKRTEQK